ncbi:hypothetical protein BU25DRAFT_491963 [Macroventuria anomochaeta]|uniref:Uncharacterized protein n=1 Tax=Macroventuria anomochaeta TaxID=301207 RepID=A0ACB6RZN7_9PLEO|nr:uncharacterized protein BU25DRAFT_491963 [Macroventuria anomochaeta]KAF2626618.1 hypothetical protein BU25DRAFT_491963 [Macroventuria anomochaeta]
MPPSKKCKLTIWAATIEDAKDHVRKIRREAKFDYGLPANYNLRRNDPHHIVWLVKDRTCFLVAAHAVESDIARLLHLILTWPTEFQTADVTAKYIAGVCALQKFAYTRFEGVAENKFRGYVTWSTVRRAWELGNFEIKTVPKKWVQKSTKSEVVDKNAHTMTDAIESDIARLTSLIPPSSWPPRFTDLNEARNFIGQCCYGTGFKYTGCPDVAMHKYRLFVNFNAAKYALEDGMFEVEREVPERKALRKALRKAMSGGRDRKVERNDEVRVVDVKGPAAAREEDARVCDGADCLHDVKTVEWNDYDTSNFEPWPACSFSSSEIAYSENGVGAKALADHKEDVVAASAVLEEAAAVDSFKKLVADLQRRYVLKAAFE